MTVINIGGQSDTADKPDATELISSQLVESRQTVETLYIILSTTIMVDRCDVPNVFLR